MKSRGSRVERRKQERAEVKTTNAERKAANRQKYLEKSNAQALARQAKKR